MSSRYATDVREARASRRPSARPPRFTRRVRRPLVDELDEALEIGRIRVRQDAVAEVEDVAGPSAGAPRGSSIDADSTRSNGPSSERGIEVPLHAALAADPLPALVERDAPVEADHVASGRGHRARAGARCRCRSGSSARRRRRGSASSTARRTPRSRPGRARRPTSRRAGPHPRPPRPSRAGRPPRSPRASRIARARRSGAPYMQRLRERELARRPALDEVARDRERAAAETDEACSRASAARTSRTASRMNGTASSGSGTRRRSTSAIVRTGSATTGPTPSTRSTSMPIPRTGSMMSANITAASTPCTRTG